MFFGSKRVKDNMISGPSFSGAASFLQKRLRFCCGVTASGFSDPPAAPLYPPASDSVRPGVLLEGSAFPQVTVVTDRARAFLTRRKLMNSIRASSGNPN